jgi:hypothetical protein
MIAAWIVDKDWHVVRKISVVEARQLMDIGRRLTTGANHHSHHFEHGALRRPIPNIFSGLIIYLTYRIGRVG